MTTRTPSVAKRPSRSSRDSHDRKGLYVNLAFGLVIFIGIVALIGAAASTYAGQHFTEVATVNGQTITQEDLDGVATQIDGVSAGLDTIMSHLDAAAGTEPVVAPVVVADQPVVADAPPAV